MFFRRPGIWILILIIACSMLVRPDRESLAGVVAPPPPLGEPAFSRSEALTPDYTGCGGQNAAVINASYEQQVVNLVNAERAARSLPPLKRVSLLDNAARYHATDMAQDNYFSHDTYDRSGGSLVLRCAWSERITAYYTNWSNLGENIAAGYLTPAEVMNAWMNSDGHRANILRDTFWEIGVGYFEGAGSYYRYWAQDFGRRNGVYPVVINNDADSTDSQDVELYIYGVWSEMRIRNNADTWTSWQPFQNRVSWQLPPNSGLHTVSVEMRKTGQTAASSDTINLDLPIRAQLGNLPDSISLTYSIPSQRFLPPDVVSVTPQNIGDETILSWQVDTLDNWYELIPTTGNTPDNFILAANNFITDTIGAYTGAFTVTVTSPGGTIGSPHRTAVSLTVTDAPIYTIYLPAMIR